MKKTILFSSALVALAMLASCQKEEFIETPATATGVTEFTATIESTKTAIDASDGKVTWTAGDEITVTDAASKSAVYVAASGGESTTFTLKQGQTAVGAGPYTATYGDITKQKYSETGANCPLSAPETNTTNLQFSSPYAVLKITAKSSKEKSVKTVVVKYGNSSSILDCGYGEALTSTEKVFYVAVRPSTEAAALSVSFYTDDKMAKKSRTSDIALAANDLLPVTFSFSDWATPTFKAVYNTANTTLTFYYDTDEHSGDGNTVYEGSEGDKYLFKNSETVGNKKWGYDGIRGNIKSVKIDSSVAGYKGLTSTAYMFQLPYATSISGEEYLDVSNVTNMSYMFANFGQQSTDLNKVPDVSGWNTGNVTNMKNLFSLYGQNSTSLPAPPDVREWNTGNVTDMGYMFSGYGKSSTSLTAVPNVSGWKTDKVTNTKNLFANYGDANKDNINCVLDLTGWNLANLAANNNVFYNFSPKTFEVTIPAKTGTKQNYANKWYYGPNGTTGEIAPPSGEKFSDENGSPLPDEPTQSN